MNDMSRPPQRVESDLAVDLSPIECGQVNACLDDCFNIKLNVGQIKSRMAAVLKDIGRDDLLDILIDPISSLPESLIVRSDKRISSVPGKTLQLEVHDGHQEFILTGDNGPVSLMDKPESVKQLRALLHSGAFENGMFYVRKLRLSKVTTTALESLDSLVPEEFGYEVSGLISPNDLMIGLQSVENDLVVSTWSYCPPLSEERKNHFVEFLASVLSEKVNILELVTEQWVQELSVPDTFSPHFKRIIEEAISDYTDSDKLAVQFEYLKSVNKSDLQTFVESVWRRCSEEKMTKIEEDGTDRSVEAGEGWLNKLNLLQLRRINKAKGRIDILLANGVAEIQLSEMSELLKILNNSKLANCPDFQAYFQGELLQKFPTKDSRLALKDLIATPLANLIK